MQKRIAVIGSGAAGMAAAFLLQKKCSVTIFEAAPRLGGHAHSVTNGDIELDVAFLVFNDRTYPNFVQWLKLLGVESASIEAEMSSCFSDPLSNMHFTLGNGLGPIVRQKRNLIRPRFWKMFVDLAAFRKRAYLDLTSGKDFSTITLGEYLKPYGRELRENFVLPFASAIWSLDDGNVFDFPAESILRYFFNHGLLKGKSDKRWRTLKGSSGIYVRAFEKSFKGIIHLGTPVLQVNREASGVAVVTARGTEIFDEVVLATHADLSLKLLGQPNTEEKKLLGPWRYQNNPVVLHQDASALHADPGLWASWNMKRGENGKYVISYLLNRVQNFYSEKNFVLTLGEEKFQHELARFTYRHPIFSLDSVSTQSSLPELNGKDRIYFCGSYFGYGFHEDAIASAVAIAAKFGINWETK